MRERVMYHRSTSGKVNVKLLVILIAVVAAVGLSLVFARQIRRRLLSEQARVAGQAALDKQDWPAAAKNFRAYLARNPDDLDILRKYSDVLMAMRLPDTQALTSAIAACRRITELDPQDDVASERLAKLYRSIGKLDEFEKVARTRMAQDANDLATPLWLAEAQIRLNKRTDARQTLEAFIQRLEGLGGVHVEYVRACVQMSVLAADANTADANTPKPSAPGETPVVEEAARQLTPLDWLTKAVAYAPASAEALVYRARFHRIRAMASDVSEVDKAAFRVLARQDLEAAERLGTEDPRVGHALAEEWIRHGDLDRADAQLQAADKLPKDVLKEELFGDMEWSVKRFHLGWELAVRQADGERAAILADETLASLAEHGKSYKSLVLPLAIQAYVGVGRTADARRCLEEHVGSVQGQLTREQERAIAVLKGLVAAAENKPYAVIDVLQAVVGSDPKDPQMLRLLAQAYSDTGQAARAVVVWEQYLRLNPQDQRAQRELARQYAQSSNFERAFNVAKEAEATDPTDLGRRMLRIGADISRSSGSGKGADVSRLKELSTELAELKEQYPDRVDIRIFQSFIATSLGQPEQAERELKQAIEECKEPLRAEMQLVRHYVVAKRVQEAIGVCEAACKRHEGDAEPWVALSDLYVMQEDYDSARRSLQRGLDLAADGRAKRSVSARLAVLELAHGDRAAGINLLKELAGDPQEVQARLLLLGVREIREDPGTAARLVDELRQAEGQTGLWWRLYQASIWLSGPDAAAKHKDIVALLEYCVNADRTWPAPVLLLAEAYQKRGELGRVEEVYRQALAANIENPSVAGQVGELLLRLLERQRRYAEAETVLRQIQNRQIAGNWQVRLAVGARDFSRAIDDLKLRVSNDKDKRDADARVELARLLYQETKDAGEAMRYLDEAKAIAPDSRVQTAVRVSILRAQGKDAEAQKVLDDYVADYNDFNAYWMRAVYWAEAGQSERAEQDYRKLPAFADRAGAGYDLLAGFYAGTARVDQGLATVEEGLKAYPEDVLLKRRQMRLLFARAQGQDRQKALEVLTELEAKLPQDVELLMTRATQILSDPSATPQSRAVAKEKYETVVKLEPTMVIAHLALIGMAMQEQQYQTACDLAVRALASNANHPALLVARARAELLLGYPSMATKLASQVLQADPNRVDAVDVLVQAALNSRDRAALEQALAAVESAQRSGAAGEAIVLARVRVLVALGRAEAAIPETEAYCQTAEGGRGITALVTLADLYRMVGNLDKAQQVLAKAEQMEPNSQAVVHGRFLLLVSMKRFDDLNEIASAYISAQGQDMTIVRNAAYLLVSLGSPQLRGQAVKLFQHGVSLWPDSADLRRGLASSLYQTGDTEASERAYRELLERHPDDAQSLNDLAWILQEKYQRYDEALKLVNRGIRIRSGDLHLLDTKGTILSSMPGRLAEARSCFEEILTLAGADARRLALTHFQLGRVHVKLKDAAQAQQHLKKALEIDSKENVLSTEERSEITRLLDGLAAPAASPPDGQK
jgi:tetratricopeptide (TPR) repeat protein